MNEEIRRRNKVTVEMGKTDKNYIVTNVKKTKGKWVKKYFPDEPALFRERWYCSECGDWQTYGKTNFCMNCGADMRGGETDDTV